MNKNIVGLDWDNITLKEAKTRQKHIENIEKTSTLLFQRKNGYHLKIIYNKKIPVETNLKIRKKYNDCKNRLQYSLKRLMTTGEGYDILFTMKKNHWEKLIG